MDETSNGGQMDSWMSARLGNAIDALTDRVLARPQMGSDPAQAYGVDQNGRLYALGQSNGQIAAQVTTVAPGGNKMLPWLIIAAIVFFAVESK